LQRPLSREEMGRAYALAKRVSVRYAVVKTNPEISSLDKGVWDKILNDEFEKDSYFKKFQKVNSKKTR